MTGDDFIKLAIVGPLFLVLAPFAGLLLHRRPGGQRAAFAIMAFMTINGLFEAGNWGLTLGSIEGYRGHTKGYHFYFNHAIAVALIVARWLDDRRGFRFVPPGLGWYLAYCGVSLLSIVNAQEPNLTAMAAHKMVFASLIMIAAYNVLRTEDDLHRFLRVMAWTMAWEFLVVLKLKYIDGMYQVRGTFEHQNPLAMYAVCIGMVFAATALGPVFKGANLALVAFVVCAGIVQSTLSRAALAAFAAGAVGVIGLSVLERPTPRRLTAVSVLGVLGALGLLLSLDTIISRFRDEGNIASSELRQVMNRAAREMATDRFFGIGWNNYALVVNPPYRYSEVYHEWVRERGMKVDETRPNAVVESHYYLLLGETGWPGLAFYLAMIAVGLWRNVRAFHFFGHSFRRFLALGIAVGTGLNYAQSTLERVLVQPRNLMLWLILLGITARLETMRREETPKVPPSRRRSPASATAGTGSVLAPRLNRRSQHAMVR